MGSHKTVDDFYRYHLCKFTTNFSSDNDAYKVQSLIFIIKFIEILNQYFATQIFTKG